MQRFKTAIVGAAMVLAYFVATTVAAVVMGVAMFSLSLLVLGIPNPGILELARISAAVTFVAKFISGFFKEGD